MSNTKQKIQRPAVVAVMGHIDHGKSTLLDYLRQSNVVSQEAGGITQRLGAYEVTRPDQSGKNRTLTFIDTPGHAAFSGMRERSAAVADIAVLVVSAEDGVKAQTIEAINIIKEHQVPFIVALTKIDRPEANIERAKQSLAEHGVFVEGYGGTTSAVPISATTGEGIDELLEVLFLTTELEGFTGDPDAPASGVVIESQLDPKRGIAATLIIKDGTLTRGEFVVAGTACAPTRIMEDAFGNTVQRASFSSPVRVVGFNNLPAVGSPFSVVTSKREAETLACAHPEQLAASAESPAPSKDIERAYVPVILKADTIGTKEAVMAEVGKLATPEAMVKFVHSGIGEITESDLKLSLADPKILVVAFGVGADRSAKDLMEKTSISVHSFDVIYKLTEWLAEILEERRPRRQVEELIGRALVLKVFTQNKSRQVIGCRVEEGVLTPRTTVRIIRRDFEIGSGEIVGIERKKEKVGQVVAGEECGILIETKIEVAQGDRLEAFAFVTK